jgi:hypothetical protein
LVRILFKANGKMGLHGLLRSSCSENFPKVIIS